MSSIALRTVPAFVPEALAASNVGTWQTGQSLQYYITDATVAAMFDLSPEETYAGAHISLFTAAVYPADRAVFHERLEKVTANGGLFVIEYRTRSRNGRVRWLLARGRYERDQDGIVAGRGIVIDITESKLDGHVEDRALFTQPDYDDTPLDRACAMAIDARLAIDELKARPEYGTLRIAVDTLLRLLGRALARDIARSTH